MKGIELCADCAYYSMKTHKCGLGCTIEPDLEKGEDVRFFVDCLLPEVQEIRHGHWIKENREVGGCFKLYQSYIHCSECGNEHYYGTGTMPKYCDECGARMDLKDGEQNDRI